MGTTRVDNCIFESIQFSILLGISKLRQMENKTYHESVFIKNHNYEKRIQTYNPFLQNYVFLENVLSKGKYSYLFFKNVFFFLLLKNWLKWWEFLCTLFSDDVLPKAVGGFNVNWSQDVPHIFLQESNTRIMEKK